MIRSVPALAAAACLLLGACSNGDGSAALTPNRAPVVNAGPDRTAAVGQPVTLQAEGTDPDGDALQFGWQLSVVPPYSGAHLAVTVGPETILVPDVEGVYVVVLWGFDGELESAPDPVMVRVGSAGGGGTQVSVYAGPDRTVAIGTPAELDGTGSFDPAGLPLDFAWTLDSRPVGSAAALEGATSSRPTLVPDVEGAYLVTLTVTARAGGTATDSVTITAANLPPTADPGGDRDVYVGTAVALVANAVDPDGELISYLWTLESKPAGSAAEIAGSTLAEATLVPDVPGWYLVSLVVSDPSGAAAPKTFTVRATPPLLRLTHRVLDAEYAAATERLVMVDSDPAALYVLDPVGGAEARVILPLPPTSVSVSPDGVRAAVGHDAYVSIVDLAGARLEKTIPLPGTVGEVVLAAGGWLYAFEASYYAGGIWAVEVATGAVSEGGYFWREAANARLHASGTRIYGADRGVSPDDLIRYDISGAGITGMDSRYHGEYSMCGDLWLSEDGARIFTACGNVFRSTEAAATDITYNGRLASPEGRFLWVAHSSEARQVVAVPAVGWSGTGNEDTLLRLYEDEFLAAAGTVAVSPFIFPAGVYAGHARSVFFSSDGSRRFALVQADASSAVLLDYGLMSF